MEASHFVAEVIGQKQSLVLIRVFHAREGDATPSRCDATTHQKGQRCGMCALLQEVDIFMGFLCLLENGGLKMGFEVTEHSSGLRGLLMLIVWVVLSYQG